MQQGRKSSGGQGLPDADRAAEEQATTRGRKRVRKVFQAEILYVHCLRFSPGPFYIVDQIGKRNTSKCRKFLASWTLLNVLNVLNVRNVKRKSITLKTT
jgi:hypothetical protein